MRSVFWDDLVEDLRDPRLRRTFRRATRRSHVPDLTFRQRFAMRLINRLPHVTVREAVSPQALNASMPEEERLLNRRCRCGKLATELHRECAWHDATSAQYAATLLAVLNAAEALVPGTIVEAARVAADDAELAAQPWFRDGLADWRAGRVRKA